MLLRYWHGCIGKYQLDIIGSWSIVILVATIGAKLFKDILVIVLT